MGLSQDLACFSKDASCFTLGRLHFSQACQRSCVVESGDQEVRMIFPEQAPLDFHDRPECLFGFPEPLLRIPDLSDVLPDQQGGWIAVA